MSEFRFLIKKCSKCKEVKSIDEFNRRSSSKDGLDSHCNDCKRYYSIKRLEKAINAIIPDEKICTKCKLLKTKYQFYTNKKWTDDGLQNWCKECIKEARKTYYNNNSKELKKRGRDNSRKEKLALIKAYGGKCACCSETQWEFLTLDHKDNDGAEHRRQFGGSNRNVWRYLRKLGYPKDKYQLLCYNCNCAKGFFGYCPHQKVKDT